MTVRRRRSPCRWALALLAWCVLVMNAAQALPCVAMAGHAAASSSMPAMAADPHDACRHGDGDAVRLACHCPAMCVPALLPVPAVALAHGQPAGWLATIARSDMPQPARTPPLRPPQA